LDSSALQFRLLTAKFLTYREQSLIAEAAEQRATAAASAAAGRGAGVGGSPSLSVASHSPGSANLSGSRRDARPPKHKAAMQCIPGP